MLRKIAALFAAVLIVGAVHAQQQSKELDPTTKWATIAMNEYHVSFNIVYGKANNVDLHLDVITTGPTSMPRPTLIYFHGGG